MRFERDSYQNEKSLPKTNLFYRSRIMRKSIALFDDQYAFYKEFKSEKLLVAFVEYMFEDIEPE